MKALTFPEYGGYEVLKVQNFEIPRVKENQYLVKVHSSSLTTAESMMRRAKPLVVRLFLGLIKPKHNISGACFSGTVIRDGNKELSKDEQFDIFGEIGAELGANADYIKVKKNATILPKPDFISFEEAACLCDGTITSFYYLNQLMNAKKGDNILIHGATGSLGLAAVQFAKLKGLETSAVCSEKNFQLVKDLGADNVISYREENYLKKVGQFDFIFDCAGKIAFSDFKHVLKENGEYFCPVISSKLLLRQLMNKLYPQKVHFAAVGMLPPEKLKHYMTEVLAIIKKGDFRIPINQRYDFNNVIEAHKIIDSGHKVGNFVLNH